MADRDVTHLKTITQEIGKASSRFEKIYMFLSNSSYRRSTSGNRSVIESHLKVVV